MNAESMKHRLLKPTLFSSLVFLVLLSGPPKFRLRDIDASLRGELDLVIVLQVICWILAGLWTAVHARRCFRRESTSLHWTEKIAFCLATVMAFSTLFSDAKGLTAFKAYQFAVTVLFVATYLRAYGSQQFLRKMLGCLLLLNAADVIAAVIAPDLVMVPGEVDGLRFRGDLLAQTGEVGAFALILLLTAFPNMSRFKKAAAIALAGGVVAASLMRTSYLAIGIVMIMVVIYKPPLPWVKRLAYTLFAIAPFATVYLADKISEYRPAETIWTLSDRVGLWLYLVGITLTNGKYLGLGYFAASRTYGVEYNPELGTAHSAFVEVFAGTGFVGLTIFLALWTLMVYMIIRLLRCSKDLPVFTCASLFILVFMFLFIGGELEAEPSGFVFCFLVSWLPQLYHQYFATERVQAKAALGPSLAPGAAN